MFAEVQADLAASAPDHAQNRRAIGLPGRVAARLSGAAAGRLVRIGVCAPFLARILLEFVALGDQVGQRLRRGKNAPPRVPGSDAVAPGDGCG